VSWKLLGEVLDGCLKGSNAISHSTKSNITWCAQQPSYLSSSVIVVNMWFVCRLTKCISTYLALTSRLKNKLIITFLSKAILNPLSTTLYSTCIRTFFTPGSKLTFWPSTPLWKIGQWEQISAPTTSLESLVLQLLPSDITLRWFSVLFSIITYAFSTVGRKMILVPTIRVEQGLNLFFSAPWTHFHGVTSFILDHTRYVTASQVEVQ